MKVLAIILAGGKRKELRQLVDNRCKAAVPFLGKYRVIDFVLSNCLNSGIRHVNIIVQHKFSSLQKHIRDGWSVYSTTTGEYIDVYPPQQRYGESWYRGSADSVYQNMYTIENENPDYVLTLSGDHIYKMNYRKLIDFHITKKADLTIASVPVPLSHSSKFGVMKVGEHDRVLDFKEKPRDYDCQGGQCLASMGLYIFSTNVLRNIFKEKGIFNDNNLKDEMIGFGSHIIPKIVSDHRVFTYKFVNPDGSSKYWNYLGSLKEYYNGNMAILNRSCDVNLYDADWPFHTFQSQSPPTRTFSKENLIYNSLISSGGLIEGEVNNSILGTNVTIEPGANIEDSILFDNVCVKSGAKIKKAVIDKDITVSNALNANNLEGWSEYTVTNDNIVVIGKGAKYTN